MDRQEWNEQLKTGILWQDLQHQRFFEIRDALSSSSEAENIKQFEKALVQLDQYIADHFATEEAYMKQTGYQFAPEHLKEHQIFIKKFSRAKREFIEYKKARILGDDVALNPWLDLSLELEIWFVEHIQGSDQKLAGHLKDAKRL